MRSCICFRAMSLDPAVRGGRISAIPQMTCEHLPVARRRGAGGVGCAGPGLVGLLDKKMGLELAARGREVW